MPLDEEELSDEAVRAVAEGIADRAAGRTQTSDEVKERVRHLIERADSRASRSGAA